MKNIISLVVENLENGHRIDLFISNKYLKISRTRVKNLIKKKNLKINNTIVTDPSKKVSAGDIILLEIPEPKKVSLKPYNYKLDIIYEDKDLIVINKSAGISMHPGPGNYDNTLVNALMNYLGDNLSSIASLIVAPSSISMVVFFPSLSITFNCSCIFFILNRMHILKFI